MQKYKFIKIILIWDSAEMSQKGRSWSNQKQERSYSLSNLFSLVIYIFS